MTEQEDDGYELFSRAIQHRDADAWATIYVRYRPLLLFWAYRSGAGGRVIECAEDIADQALARAWAALTPERFADFPSLPRLMSYLRSCVATAAIDSSRAQLYSERVTQALATDTAPTPEQIILADLDRDTLWQTVFALATTPAERLTLVETCVYGLPPRAIQARHPQMFPDVGIVYSTKRNLFERLQRNPILSRLREELISI
jgi:DNA-directed RNA polymerase specialized sigma24 family protein